MFNHEKPMLDYIQNLWGEAENGKNCINKILYSPDVFWDSLSIANFCIQILGQFSLLWLSEKRRKIKHILASKHVFFHILRTLCIFVKSIPEENKIQANVLKIRWGVIVSYMYVCFAFWILRINLFEALSTRRTILDITKQFEDLSTLSIDMKEGKKKQKHERWHAFSFPKIL